MNSYLSHILNYILFEYIISLLCILAWRGIYRWFDVFLYPSNEDKSASASLLIGYALFFFLMYTQSFQNDICLLSTFIKLNYPSFIENLRHLCAFIVCVLIWRGYWILIDAHIATLSFVSKSPYIFYLLALLISFVTLSIMKTASSINGPMSRVNDEYNLFPLYSNCILVNWFNRKKKSGEVLSNLNKIPNIGLSKTTYF